MTGKIDTESDDYKKLKEFISIFKEYIINNKKLLNDKTVQDIADGNDFAKVKANIQTLSGYFENNQSEVDENSLEYL